MFTNNFPEQETLQNIIGGTQNWKAAEPDRIHNFLYKKLTSTHKQLVT